MSRRDLVHVLTALADAAHAEAGVAVPVSVLDEAVGRSRNDMRTPLDLAALAADGLAQQDGPDRWSLTEAGVTRLREDAELPAARQSRPHLG